MTRLRHNCRQFFQSALISVGVLLMAHSAVGDVSTDSCSGFIYRAKREGVPVFDVPDTTGTVLVRLSLGETVCYVGEERGFAILDWTARAKSPDEKLVFARLVDLWPPRDAQQARRSANPGFFTRLKRYFNYLRSGGVPEDGLLPYRPLIGASPPSDR